MKDTIEMTHWRCKCVKCARHDTSFYYCMIFVKCERFYIVLLIGLTVNDVRKMKRKKVVHLFV